VIYFSKLSAPSPFDSSSYVQLSLRVASVI